LHGCCDYQSSFNSYSKAIELDPKYRSAYHYRGLKINKLGKLNEEYLDLSKSSELGDMSAYDELRKNRKLLA
jgi:lipoprotein NlpI